jgi:hypothetical protein
MTYEQVVQAIYDEDIEIIEFDFRGGLKGLYSDNTIAIRSDIIITTEKKCILVEELGHHYTTTGNITDLKNVSNRKKELIARKWSYEKLVPLRNLINASYSGCTNLYELAEYLDVTEEFLKDTLQYYQNKYGLYAELDNYCIYFNPLTVCKYNY